MQNRAYEVLAQGWSGGPEATTRDRMAGELARAVGTDGMIAGQATDLAVTDKAVDLPTLELIHSRKTGALSPGMGAQLFICLLSGPSFPASRKR